VTARDKIDNAGHLVDVVCDTYDSNNDLQM
jgi:hypothetical protein